MVHTIHPPLKICIASTAFPRWENDFRGVFVFEAAKAMQRRGHQVSVIAMHNPKAKKKELFEGIKVFRPQYLPERFEVLQKDAAGIPSTWKRAPLARLGLIPFIFVHSYKLCRIAANYDIIHANWTLSGFAAWITKLFHQRPYIVTIQGSDIYQAIKVPFVRLITKQVLNKARNIIALSTSLRDAALEIGVSPEKILVIPNGVDTSKFQFNAGHRENIILFAGSLIERKGVKILIQAYKHVVNMFPEYQLVIVGEGDQRPAIIELIKELDLVGQVEMVGTVPQSKLNQLMQISKVFVAPSFEEGQGVVLIEAMASGTPVIGSSVGGIVDVITNDVGRLVEPGDPEMLASAICDLLNDSEKWEKLSLNARGRAEEVYGWDVIAAQIEEVYYSI